MNLKEYAHQLLQVYMNLKTRCKSYHSIEFISYKINLYEYCSNVALIPFLGYIVLKKGNKDTFKFFEHLNPYETLQDQFIDECHLTYMQNKRNQINFRKPSICG